MSDQTAPPPPVPSDGGELNTATPELFVEPASGSFVDVPALGMQVRDLGLGALTGGMLAGQVFRAPPKSTPAPGTWHMHNDVTFQVGYVVCGWALYEFDGIGRRRADQGTCIVHVPRNRLRLLECSDDFEGVWFKGPSHERVTFWQFDPKAGSYAESQIDVVHG